MRQDSLTLRRLIRLTGMVILFLAISGFTGSVPDFVISSVAAGLIVWGGTRTKLETHEREIEARLRREVFVEFQTNIIDRLDRIEGKLDRGHP